MKKLIDPSFDEVTSLAESLGWQDPDDESEPWTCDLCDAVERDAIEYLERFHDYEVIYN